MDDYYLRKIDYYINEGVFLGDTRSIGEAELMGRPVTHAPSTHRVKAEDTLQHRLTAAQAASIEALNNMIQAGETGIHLSYAEAHRTGKDSIYRTVLRTLRDHPDVMLLPDLSYNADTSEKEIPEDAILEEVIETIREWVEQEKMTDKPQASVALITLDPSSTPAEMLLDRLPLLGRAIHLAGEQLGMTIVVTGNVLHPRELLADRFFSGSDRASHQQTYEQALKDLYAAVPNLVCCPLPVSVANLREAMWNSLSIMEDGAKRELQQWRSMSREYGDDISSDPSYRDDAIVFDRASWEERAQFQKMFSKAFGRLLGGSGLELLDTHLQHMAKTVLDDDRQAFEALYAQIIRPEQRIDRPLAELCQLPLPTIGQSR